MKQIGFYVLICVFSWYSLSLGAQNQKGTNPDNRVADETLVKATEWVSDLKLDDREKEMKMIKLVSEHLTAVRDWHNSHAFASVPAGINPVTGKELSELDRQIIADSAIPKSVHETLMSGLRSELNDIQTEAILDKYTIGKVAFTMKGYHAIVPDLTKEEENTILSYLKEAREMAIDYKNMKEISAIFEIYKTKSEQYLNSRGRNWKALYKAYVDQVKAEKAAARKKTN